jgi:hypothetical protein
MIPCYCINAKEKPIIIPIKKWIVKGEKYHITHVYNMVNMEGLKGCDIAEIDISMYKPFNCFKLERFAFDEKDIPALIKLIHECTLLKDIDISKLLESVEIITYNNNS